MKQGVLISGYKNLDHIKQIIDFFNDDFTFYIHIDRKSNLPESELKEIEKIKKVDFFSRKLITNWGGRNTLKSILLLSRQALKNPQLEYLHLISGGDFPAKGSTYFNTFLETNRGKEFIENFPIPTDKWENGGMNRLLYYNLYDVFNAKTHRGWKAVQYALKIQKKFNIQRRVSKRLPVFHGGSTWWTLSRNCMQYVIKYTDEHPALLRRLKYSFCSEEIYFQTVIMNSPFAGNVINNNLRYIKWEVKHNSMPAILDEMDYPDIIKSNQLFARKIEYPFSARLVEELMKKQMTEDLKMPKVTVLMAVYNGEKYLRESIESILVQTFSDFEFLIVNDGSTDKSLEIIKSFSDSRIKVVNNSKNVGVAESLNRSIGLIKGEYIARMDCDDICLPDRLAKEVAILSGYNYISIVAANVVLMDIEGKENGFWKEDINTKTHEDIYRMLPYENCISNPTVMFRTSSFKKYKYHSFRKGSEDWDLWLQMASGGERFYKINEVLVKYRIHNSSVTAGFNRKNIYRKKNAIQVRYFISKFIKGNINKFDLKVFRNGIINYIKYIVNGIHPSLLPVIARMRSASAKKVLGQFYKLYIFCRSTYYRNTSIYFFFPYSHIGGAEKVHAEIMQAVADKKPVCFITGISNENSFLEEFKKNSKLVDISLLTNYPFLSRISKKMISKFIRRSMGAVTFGCNSKFYYQLVPYFNNNVKCIDLIHAFVHRGEDGAEYWSLPVTERLDKRIVISKKTILDFKSLYKEFHKDEILLSRIEYIQNFTNVPAILNKASGRNLRILYVGRNGDEKRVYLIGKIARKINDQNVNAEFILVGDLGNAIAPEERNYCSFKGIISDENEMQNIYTNADILLLVSTREGFPMVIMEAMANGLVVISTDVGGIPEHVVNGENGLLISAKSEEEIVKDNINYILLLNSHRDMLHEISVNAYNYAKKNFNKKIFQESYRKILLPKEIKG